MSHHVYVNGRYVAGKIVFHRSLDGGATWSRMSLDANFLLTDFEFDTTTTPEKIYGINYYGLYSSTDAGANWTKISDTPDNMWSVELDPATRKPLYASGQGQGVWRSEDAGATWHVVSQGMNALQPWSIAASPVLPQQVYAAASTGGGFVSQNAGQGWKSLNTLSRESINRAAADPIQPCIGYLGAGGQVYKTTDCGNSWNASPFPANLTALAVDPHNPETVFAGANGWGIGDGSLFRSTNGGTNWQQVSLSIPISTTLAIAFDPMITGTVYIATGTATAKADAGGGIYKSTDGGTNWQIKTSGQPIGSLAIDPTNSNVIYATAVDAWQQPGSGGLYKSTTGGDSWVHVGSGEPQVGNWMTSVVIDPLNTQTLYWGAGGKGLYKSTDGGTSVTKAAGPLGSASINCLAITASADRTFLYVGAAGGVISTSAAARSGARAPTDQIIGGGVYQQTIDRRRSAGVIYLPLVSR